MEFCIKKRNWIIAIEPHCHGIDVGRPKFDVAVAPDRSFQASAGLG
jgi:hypothetical protein